MFFNEWLSVFQYQNLVAGFNQLQQLLFRQWILADLKYRVFTTFRIVFHQIIVADTASDDSQFFVRAVYVFVVRRFLGSFDEFVLAGKQYFIAFAGISRQQDKLTGIFTE